MATNLDVPWMAVEERFAQLARAGLPFNPVDGTEIGGNNLKRLQHSMSMYKWDDPRFITSKEALANGWSIQKDAPTVQILVRNDVSGTVENIALVNAKNVDGMPPLAAMLAMSRAEITAMRSAVAASDLDDELSIGPARVLTLMPRIDDIERKEIAERLEFSPRLFDGVNYRAIEDNYHGLMQVPNNHLSDDEAKNIVRSDVAALREIYDKNERHFAALMMESAGVRQESYKAELVRQAPEIVEEVAAARDDNDRRLIEPVAIQAEKSPVVDVPVTALDGASVAADMGSAESRFAVLAAYWQNGLHNPKGVALAREINKAIAENKLAEDRDAIARLLAVYPDARRMGIEIVPESQYLGDRDLKANVAEPRSLLNGALVRDKEGAYRPAAGGLAVLQDKGDSLALKGKSAGGYQAAMELALAKGWTAIELKGKPAMLANAWLEAKMLGLDVVNYAPTEKDKLKYAERVAEESKLKAKTAAEQSPEMVEVRPFVDADGLTKTATATYTVSNETGQGAGVAGPAVIRTVVRADDVVRSDIAAGVDLGKATGATVQKILDQELDQAVAQNSGKLLDHGMAPYQHDPKNKTSYFAVIDSGPGKQKTLWGIDIDRSLAESGAKIGDVISLTRVGKKSVMVNEKQPDGPMVEKEVDRITWETDVLNRAMTHQLSPTQDLVSIAPTAVLAGQYAGPILAVEGNYISQKIGRKTTDIVWHDVSNLRGSVPKVGEMAEIAYSNGLGAVKENTHVHEMDGGGRGLGQ